MGDSSRTMVAARVCRIFILVCLLQCGKEATAAGAVVDDTVVVVIGSTVFTKSETFDECMERLRPDRETAGSDMKACVTEPQTTPTPGQVPNPSGGRIHTMHVNGTVTFVCQVTGMRKNDTFSWDVLWQDEWFNVYQEKGDSVHINGRSDHYEFESVDKSLWRMTIKNVRRRDAGLYKCIVTSDGPQSEKFTLNVTYPVEINGVLPNRPPHVRGRNYREIYFNETDNATLSCLSDGNPAPYTFWRRGNHTDRGTVYGGKNMTIYNVSVEDEGLYVCHTRQTELHTVSHGIIIKVQHKPNVSAQQQILRKQKGRSVTLVCSIDSDPLTPTAKWFVDGRQITREDDPRISELTVQHDSSLSIVNLVPHKDYRNYTCQVTNVLGSSNCSFEITGRPTRPEIISPFFSDMRNSYTLEWTYNDHDKAKEKTFMMFFGQTIYKPRGIKRDMVTKLRYNEQRPWYYNTTIRGLWENSTYYIQLFAQNEYGQGESAFYEFRTAAVDRKPSAMESEKYVSVEGLEKAGNSGRMRLPSITVILGVRLLYLLLT